MNDVIRTLRELVGILEDFGLTYAVIGGIAVRAYAIPRPTFDIDFTLAIPRERLSELQRELLKRRRYVETPDGDLWIASPEDIVLLKLLSNRGRDAIDVKDILFTQGELDRSYLEQWARWLQVGSQLEEALRAQDEMT